MILDNKNQHSIVSKTKKGQIFKNSIKKLIDEYNDYFLKQQDNNKINLEEINPFIKIIRDAVIHFDIFKSYEFIDKYNQPLKYITYFNIYQFLFLTAFVQKRNMIKINLNDQFDKMKKNKITFTSNDFYNNFLPKNQENKYHNLYNQNCNKTLSYSKKFLKIINLPFAYCNARYKLLTNEKIFNQLEQFGKNIKHKFKHKKHRKIKKLPNFH